MFGVLALVAKSKFDAAGVHCGGGSCDPEGKRITDDARGLGNVETIVFGAGAALAAGGIVLWLTAPSRSGANRAASQRTPDRRSGECTAGVHGDLRRRELLSARLDIRSPLDVR